MFFLKHGVHSLALEFTDYFNQLICFCSQHSCICICMLYVVFYILCLFEFNKLTYRVREWWWWWWWWAVMCSSD